MNSESAGRGTGFDGPLAEDDVAALRLIMEGTARNTGQEFFQSLVRHLAQAVGTRYALVAEFAGEMRARTVAYWLRDQIIENVEWDLAGTPCEEVVRGQLCHHPTGVKDKFSSDKPLVEWGIESYLGVPLCDSEGRHLGHMAVFDERPMSTEPRRLYTFQIFAARAAAELERMRMEDRLTDSEERYRDLYDEAPIAYVKEDFESRFITANRAAQRILGIKPEEVTSTYGLSLVPDTPEAKKRAQDALATAANGVNPGGVVLELRRKDNGQPAWIQWWSKPEPGGKYTRTMFLDITERVLMEQQQARLTAQNNYLQEEIKAAHNFEEIVGQSPALTRVLSDISRVAATDATVLITGETGTGKELIARAIHSASKRKDKPLIKINCAALPAGLVESELFGHEKGAFSGAIGRRIGRFELADGGTIFLDEIGELPADAQAKLLRVLQEREFDRVGGGVPIQVDVRVIAATNRDLQQLVRDQKYREDLFYRLNVFPVRLPPLRDRAADIPLLAHFLVRRFANRIGKTIEGIGSETMKLLRDYHWPGNVRELENVLERAVILSGGSTLEIDPEVLALPFAATEARDDGRLEDVERSHIRDVLDKTNWVIEGERGAAKVLGLHPNTLRSRMKKLGLARPAHDPS